MNIKTILNIIYILIFFIFNHVPSIHNYKFIINYNNELIYKYNCIYIKTKTKNYLKPKWVNN